MVRVATPDDAGAIAAIYAPVVRDTAISFETDAPDAATMRARIATTLSHLPWLVSLDAAARVDGYAYAGRHRERAAYQWSVDVTVYVRDDARGRGIARRLYEALFAQLAVLGHREAFAGIALPNDASVALHEAMGFAPIGIYRRVGFKHGAWRDVGWWQRSIGAAQPTLQPAPPASFDAAHFISRCGNQSESPGQ